MGNICETILSKEIAVACEDMVSKGMEADGVIINREDIDFTATEFDETNKNIIKRIVLKSAKQGYKVVQPGNTPYTGTKSSLVVGTYRNSWTHEVVIVVLANNPDVAANIIDRLANGKFVLVLRNVTKGKDGAGEFQVYGYAQGLTCSAGENDKYSEDTEGGWLMTLQETSAPRSAMFLYNTDRSTTTAQYEALTTPSSVV